MLVRLCINELSFRIPSCSGGQVGQSPAMLPLFADRYKARDALTQFISLIAAAHKYGAERGLYATEWDAFLAQDYRLAQWRADKDVCRDQRDRLRLWQANRGANPDTLSDDVEHRYDYVTTFPSGEKPESVKRPPALSVAAENSNWIVVSLLSDTPTEAEWDRAVCIVSRYSLEENVETSISVNHAAREKHLYQHAPKLPGLAPEYIRDHRQAHDDETFLANRERYQSTGFNFHGRIIYHDSLGNYYHVDNLHRGRDSHIEYYGPSKNHLGTLWPDGSSRSGPKPDRYLDLG